MTIEEMHVWFRQYAQQMGMQNVRAILPEQIDLLINTSITDTINQLIKENIGITNDRVITDNSKIGQINAFNTLYKVLEINANPSEESNILSEYPFTKADESFLERIYASFDNISDGNGKFEYLFLVDLAISYKNNNTRTNYFPVRLIDDAYLADTINDFILRPRLRTPVAVIYNNQIDIYLDVLVDHNLPQYLVPYKLRISYIAKPATVRYQTDLGGVNVDCDLPEYMHIDILKHAIDLYRISISGALSASQQQEQAQQQESARNDYRNEGYQK